MHTIKVKFIYVANNLNNEKNTVMFMCKTDHFYKLYLQMPVSLLLELEKNNSVSNEKIIVHLDNLFSTGLRLKSVQQDKYWCKNGKITILCREDLNVDISFKDLVNAYLTKQLGDKTQKEQFL